MCRESQPVAACNPPLLDKRSDDVIEERVWGAGRDLLARGLGRQSRLVGRCRMKSRQRVEQATTDMVGHRCRERPVRGHSHMSRPSELIDECGRPRGADARACSDLDA